MQIHKYLQIFFSPIHSQKGLLSPSKNMLLTKEKIYKNPPAFLSSSVKKKKKKSEVGLTSLEKEWNNHNYSPRKQWEKLCADWYITQYNTLEAERTIP